jgi:hypothetical protein
VIAGPETQTSVTVRERCEQRPKAEAVSALRTVPRRPVGQRYTHRVARVRETWVVAGFFKAVEHADAGVAYDELEHPGGDRPIRHEGGSRSPVVVYVVFELADGSYKPLRELLRKTAQFCGTLSGQIEVVQIQPRFCVLH